MKFLALIPARYASTRFPAKPLACLGGKYIIQRVYERVSQVFSDAYVATDDERIYDVVLSFGGKAVMTRTDHKSGTDRCFEALQKLEAKGNKYDVVVNIQGDEPFIAASQLEAIKDCFNTSFTEIATLVKPFASDAPLSELLNPNSPKVVMNNDGNALYFSRSVIPYLRNIPQEKWLQHHTFYKHIGLYAYRVDILAKITSLPQGILEQSESLEQLRWLEAGLTIKVKETDIETIGIDTPEDLQRAEIFLSNNQ